MQKLIYKNSKATYLVVLILFTSAACNKFLDESPSKTTAVEVTTADQLDQLLNNYTLFSVENNPTVAASSDDYEQSIELYRARPNLFSLQATFYANWDTQYIPNIQPTIEAFWTDEYRKIFYANMVLSNLSKVTGSDEQKKRLSIDAHFIRAYTYWGLVNTYGLPYTDANRNELGVPIKNEVSFEENIERKTLQQVYTQIEADLQEALKCEVPLVQQGIVQHWRANTAGINGFAARYYLHRNDYASALSYAEKALAEYNRLVNYNTEMRFGRDNIVNLDPGTPNARTFNVQMPYLADNQNDFTDRMAWKEFLYFRQHKSTFSMPSRALLNLYDKDHDLRYKYHITEGYSYLAGATNPSYDYPAYIFFFVDSKPSGPTVAEMLLIKAECLSRTNNVPAAMETLNVLRRTRFTPGPWVDLNTNDKAQAIKFIIDERRREMPFSQRWYDIRRYNNNEDPNDDVELSKQFYPFNETTILTNQPIRTYTLTKHSRRFAAPIPNNEIQTSQGKIIQNTY